MAKKPSVILGISYSHGDSSAALIVDGCLLAACEEERFTRVKHYALFPFRSIEYCLKHADISPKDVQVIAIARRPWNAWAQRLSLYLRHPGLFRGKTRGTKRDGVKEELAKAGLQRAKVVRVEHHLAHMYSARYMTESESVALLSFDGLGDFVSAAIGKADGNDIDVLDRVYFPHSIGYFYTAMTQYLGFPYFGDEFKVMGLSSYGEEKYVTELHELIRENHDEFGFRLNLEAFPILSRPMSFYIQNAQPMIEPFYNANFIRTLIGIPPRKKHEPLTQVHRDLAKSVQTRFEQVANHLVKQLHAKVGGDTLALAGGCAHNSVWVGKIPQSTPYRHVFVAPACHDAGIAVGAAAKVADITIVPEGRHWGLLGPDHQTPESASDNVDLAAKGLQTNKFDREEDLIAWMVEQLCKQKIIGLFHGRMEFGPRALGSRSIIADPRDPKMKDRLNERVKHRETFRPFAASVLWEMQDQWFDHCFFSPNMEAVFPVKTDLRAKIPAVTHADNSCRIQSVTQETQPFYWKLINAFYRKTNVPMIVNTSFNDSEPIVCTKKDALNCFLNTEMDVLVIGQEVYWRDQKALQKAG